MLIVVFARSNHPYGYGYQDSSYGGWHDGRGRAHGYSVVGVRCRQRTQIPKVLKYVQENGINLPDENRGIYSRVESKKGWELGVGQTERWYSGGPTDWDYLFTVHGDLVDMN